MEHSKSDHLVWGLCLTMGQLLETLSTFFWNEQGRHTVNGSVLVILGMVFWAVGFIGLFRLFRDNNPWYAHLGLCYAFYGCLGGIGFGFEGLYSQIFGVEKIGVDAHAQFPTQMNLVLFWSGPAFPLSLMIMGTMFLVKKLTPSWVAIMIIVGALAFPVSRIFRIPWTAHLADVILLIPIIFITVHFIQGNEKRLEHR